MQKTTFIKMPNENIVGELVPICHVTHEEHAIYLLHPETEEPQFVGNVDFMEFTKFRVDLKKYYQSINDTQGVSPYYLVVTGRNIFTIQIDKKGEINDMNLGMEKDEHPFTTWTDLMFELI